MCIQERQLSYVQQTEIVSTFALQMVIILLHVQHVRSVTNVIQYSAMKLLLAMHVNFMHNFQ